MKTHTSSFKEQIKLMGKEIDSRITFGSTVLGKDDLNAVTPSYQGAILKSVMKQLDIDSNVEIPIGTILKYEFGLKVNGKYEYINYGNYVVYSIEKQEDTNSYKITCYDKLLYSMLDYVKLPITYPISIRDYINAISTTLGLKFANKSGTFANYNKQIQADLYDGLGYTFRDILDELAQVTASTICLNNNDELEIRYITETEDTIDEEFLKDVNVNFGEKFGAVNTIVLSRSGDSDSVYYPSVLPANPYEIKISDNQIMNGNDRADFLPDIYNKLNGLEFYTNDFVSTGICYYDLCDRYSVKIGDTTYSCVMFNNEVLVTQGLEENVYTELPEQTETDYKHSSKDDRMINQVYLIVKKNEAEILAVINTTEQLQKEINPTKNESGSSITIEDASDNPLIYLEIEGKSIQNGEPTPDTPVEIESVGYTNLFNFENAIENANIDSTGKIVSGIYVVNYAKVKPNTTYIITRPIPHQFVITTTENEPTLNTQGTTRIVTTAQSYIITTGDNQNYICIRHIPSNEDNEELQIEKGSIAHSYIPYGKSGIEVKTKSKNLFNKETAMVGYYVNYKTGGMSKIEEGFTSADFIEVKPNTQYYCNFVTFNSSTYGMAYYDENKKFISGSALINSFVTPDNTKYIRFCFRNENYSSGTSITDINKVQLEEGTKATEYQPYQEITSLVVLDAPLRSLPNGVKDIAYIRNNKLYVDRYVGSVVLDGSETYTLDSSNKLFGKSQNDLKSDESVVNVGSDYFKAVRNLSTARSNNNTITSYGSGIYINGYYFNYDIPTFKTWLSTHNTQVDYELATPVTEELDEIEMLKTLKGYNNISTTDKLLPIINLTYVRDTVIADYVENHVTELKLTENKIKASVESVSSSVDGLNTTINRVEEITNDNSQVINVISTNIDRTSGEVREVTTTTGFTFNADGMTIDDGSGFKAQHRSNGTYYKDGDSIVGQYTKDGSKQKDLELFGTYSYGKETIDDIPMFIGQLYTNENGEQAFGHFYNGEG